MVAPYAFAVIAFLSSLYPFLHNTVLYFINLVGHPLIGTHLPPMVNLALIGWKDGALLVALLVFFGSFRWWYAVVGALGIAACFYTDGLNGVKVLFEPLAVLIAFLVYRKEALAWFQKNRGRAFKVLAICMAGLLIVGYADLIYRFNVKVEQLNWTEFHHLRANNEYRCAKNAITGGAGPESLSCLNSMANFYKLDIVDGEYIFMPALFLPIGDSVVYSVLIFYFLVFYLCQAHLPGRRWGGWQASTTLFLAFSIFRTLNRINSLVTVISLVFLGVMGAWAARDRKERGWYLGGMLAMLALYVYDAHYLFLSMFNNLIPSNLGHTEAFESIRPGTPAISFSWLSPTQALWAMRVLAFGLLTVPFQILWKSQRRAWAGLYAGFIASYYLLSFKIHVPIRIVSKGYPGPSESDFAKGLALFGALGVAIYSVILSFMVWGLVRLVQTSWQRRRSPAALIPLGLAFAMAVEFLGYQFLAPYFISGYAIYGSFFVIWFLLCESQYARSTT